MVEGKGFEPLKASPADLQSAPFSQTRAPLQYYIYKNGTLKGIRTPVARMKTWYPRPLDDEGKKMVGLLRFELRTPCSQNRCATKLRHSPSTQLLVYLKKWLPSRVFLKFFYFLFSVKFSFFFKSIILDSSKIIW